MNNIFDKWNSHKGGGWRGHSKLSVPTKEAIDKAVRKYGEPDILQAIDNYAMVLKEKKFKWTYAWNLREFLTRGRHDNREEKQLWRWLPGEFEEKDYIDPAWLRKKREREERNEPKPKIKVATKEEKAKIREIVLNTANSMTG